MTEIKQDLTYERRPPMIHRFPPELLSETFLHCLPEGLYNRPSPDTAPLLLGRVCSAWRTLSTQTPRLWTSLDLYSIEDATSEIWQPDIGSCTSLMLLWLQRSAACPLSWSIRGDLFSSEDIFDIFSLAMERLQNARLDISDSSFFDFRALPSLLDFCEIHVNGYGLDPGTRDIWISCFVNMARRLRRFTWDDRSQPMQFHWNIEPRWSQLTHLTMNNPISVEHSLEILRGGCNLISVSLPKITDYDERTQNLPKAPVIQPNLRFCIFCSSQDISSIFDQLTLPNLHTLVLKLSPWPHTAIREFFLRSRCPVESLNLYYPLCSEPELIGYLELFHSSLQELTVHMTSDLICDTILDLLTYKDGSTDVKPCLCPKLEVVGLYECIACSPGNLSRMVESRLQAPTDQAIDRPRASRMKVIEMFDNEAELVHLQPLRKHGLMLKLYSSTTGLPIPPDEETAECWKKLQAEGLELHTFNSSSGFFGVAED